MKNLLLVWFGLLLLIQVCHAEDYSTVDSSWMPSKLYFHGGSLRPRVMDLIEDPDAPTGKAGYSKTGVKEASMLADSYSYESIPGKYITTFYFKVSDNTSDKAVFSYFVAGATKNDPRAVQDPYGSIYVKASDFEKPGVYQKFTYEWEYYEYGFMVIAGSWLGKQDLWWDGYETKLLKPFSDQELIKIYQNPPKQKYYGKFPPENIKIPPEIPKNLRIKQDVPRVAMIAGIFYDQFGIEKAIKTIPKAKIDIFPTLSGQQTRDIVPDFPATKKLFSDYNIIVLADVDIRRLGFLRRLIIKGFVERGGGLLVLGGPWTYGRCPMKGTTIDAMLPIGTKGISDWIKLPEGSNMKWTTKAPKSIKSATENLPGIRYIHDVTVRPKGRIFMQADGRPVLVAGKEKKGRVLAFTGTPMGMVGKEKKGFWESDKWPKAMAAILKWLAQTRK